MSEDLLPVGNTPLVRLRCLPGPARWWGKLEGCNPTGSSKDRAAAAMLSAALEAGDLRPGGTVVESSSGNMAVALAAACIRLHLRFVAVVDPTLTGANLRLLRTYGAEVLCVGRPALDGTWLPARLEAVAEYLRKHPDAWRPDQYANPAAADGQAGVAREILDARLDLDAVYVPTSTCGTLRGVAAWKRISGRPGEVVAVDAVGSVLFGAATCRRAIPGLGAAVRPAHLTSELADRAVLVRDAEAVEGCLQLLQEDGLLCGGSSGAAVAAARRDAEARPLPAGDRVLLLPDRGDRYLDTIFDGKWRAEHVAGWDS